MQAFVPVSVPSSQLSVRAEYVPRALPDETNGAPLVRAVPVMIACPHDKEAKPIVNSTIQLFVMLFDVIITNFVPGHTAGTRQVRDCLCGCGKYP
jgi:hypothetical protein